MPKYPKRTMKEKYNFHSNRAFENHKPKGSKMTKAEKAAFSAGYVKHAKDTARIAKYNEALDCGYTKEQAREFAKSKNQMIDWNTGRIVEKTK